MHAVIEKKKLKECDIYITSKIDGGSTADKTLPISIQSKTNVNCSEAVKRFAQSVKSTRP